MVEFAIVLPMLVLLIFGIIQFGLIYKNQLALTDAVYRAISRWPRAFLGARLDTEIIPGWLSRFRKTLCINVGAERTEAAPAPDREHTVRGREHTVRGCRETSPATE